MEFNTEKLNLSSEHDLAQQVGWKCPSNIAIVKYWGKYGMQLPKNPSISFTLNNAHTTTEVKTTPKSSTANFSFEFSYNNEPKPEFHPKIESFFERILPFCPYVSQVHFIINSLNSFPHSTGIASSASAMSALAICMVDLEDKWFQPFSNETQKLRKASFLARLGSGSACRSLYPHAALWGQTAEIESSSNEFAIPITVHENFKNYCDHILIVSSEEKEVSSTAGHSLMNNHPEADNRYKTANENIKSLLDILKGGDFDSFCQLSEAEADQLHLLMRTSNPPYNLLHENTLIILEKIKQYRKESDIPICYTLDAGPNVHVMFPNKFKSECERFINNELKSLCENGRIIEDYMGLGPKNMFT